MAEFKLISCRLCGTIIMKLSRDVCPKCSQQEEELFLKIKEFLRLNSGAAIWEVALACKTTDEVIHLLVNSGRLERMGVNIPHTCQTCHKIIPSGLICPDCSQAIKIQVQDLKKTVEDNRVRDETRRKKDPDRGDKGFRIGKKSP